MSAKKRFGVLSLVIRGVDEERGVITFLGTSPASDRYGDIVEPKGGDLKAYRMNPVFLLYHNYQMMPVGKSLAERIGDEGIEFDIQFDLADPLGAQAYRKYRDGFMNAVSIGFVPTDMEPLESGRGYRYKKWELLELSGVPIPANPEALQMAMAKAASDQPDFVDRLVRALRETAGQDIGNVQRLMLAADTGTRTLWVLDSTGKKQLEITLDSVLALFGSLADPRQRAGAVLSKANKERLGQARTMIDEVLAHATDDTENPQSGKTAAGTPAAAAFTPSHQLDAQVLAQVVGLALKREVDRLLGKAPS